MGSHQNDAQWVINKPFLIDNDGIKLSNKPTDPSKTNVFFGGGGGNNFNISNYDLSSSS